MRLDGASAPSRRLGSIIGATAPAARKLVDLRNERRVEAAGGDESRVSFDGFMKSGEIAQAHPFGKAPRTSISMPLTDDARARACTQSVQGREQSSGYDRNSFDKLD